METATKQTFALYDKVICNGFPGTVTEICTGAIAGMCVVRLARGTVCVTMSDRLTLQPAFTAEAELAKFARGLTGNEYAD